MLMGLPGFMVMALDSLLPQLSALPDTEEEVRYAVHCPCRAETMLLIMPLLLCGYDHQWPPCPHCVMRHSRVPTFICLGFCWVGESFSSQPCNKETPLLHVQADCSRRHARPWTAHCSTIATRLRCADSRVCVPAIAAVLDRPASPPHVSNFWKLALTLPALALPAILNLHWESMHTPTSRHPQSKH